MTPKSPDLGGIYSEAAQHHGPGRNPIVVIPGLMGSKLTDTDSGRLVWGVFEPGVADPRDAESLRLLTLPMEFGTSLSDLRDAVVPSGALDRIPIQLLGGFQIQPTAYLQLLLTLGASGFADQTLGEAGAIDYGVDHYTCFQFDYDWRRSSAENAVRLQEFINQKRTYVEAENLRRFGATDRVKFDIVAHSMGGLLARYYLRYGAQPMPEEGLPELNWDGAEDISQLILVAPPNAGSVAALDQLTRGFVMVPWQGRYEPAALGTMTSAYELLPRSRHQVLRDGETSEVLDPLDPAVWERYQWGLADPGQDRMLAILLPDVDSAEDRRRIALDHLRKSLDNARRFHAALDLPASPPEGVKISLFAGDAASTGISASAHHGGITITETGPGDGTVARYSALLDERFTDRSKLERLRSPVAWHSVTFIFENHLGLTKSPMLADNLLFRLLEGP